MKSNKRVATIALVSLLGIALIATPVLARRGDGSGRGAGRAARGRGPAFTEEQLERIEAIHESHSDERAKLTNRIKVIHVEMQDLLESDSPDLDALEDKLEEASDVRLELQKLRLRIHKEIRPLLDDDQKVLFDRGLGRLVGRMGGRGGFDGRAGRMGRSGAMMGRGMRGCMSAEGTAAGPRGMMGGPGGFPGQGGPFCPFAETDAETGE
jgi:Spy/CpxP family protein refolding chaperone